MSSSTSRRISYVLPAPTSPVPLLSLPPLTEPRNGRVSPFIIPKSTSQATSPSSQSSGGTLQFSPSNPFFTPLQPLANPITAPPDDGPDHPRHCLGVSSLALDTSTLLSTSSHPQGILYTGGRDGLVASWELGLPQKRRSRPRWALSSRLVGGEAAPRGYRKRVRWERLEEDEADGAGWGGDDGYGAGFDEDDEDDGTISSASSSDGEGYDPTTGRGAKRGLLDADEDDDGDDFLEAEGWIKPEKPRIKTGRELGKKRSVKEGIPYEQKWELDTAALEDRNPQPTTFRQSVQTHTDWVNDLVLCNMNQTLLSASSDRTIRAWSPHSKEESATPGLVGVHSDYVKVLSYAKHPGMLFSGGLDRQVMVWDVQQPRPDSPLLKLTFPDSYEGPRGSVYALTSNDAGSLVAAGSPERMVRMWDVRVGSGSAGMNSVSQLVGHTDNIRAILLSEDGKYLLSGSSDCTIKLWSLAAQRCIHTFSYHTDSVWSLYSDHPNLERFVSGDRSGFLCVTDVTGCQTDYAEAECVLVAREEPEDGRNGTQGICQIVGMDDEFIWTATGSASVKRWRDVGKKANRAGKTAGVHARRDSVDNKTSLLGANFGQGAVTPVSAPPMSDLPSTLRNKRLSIEGNFSPDNVLSLHRTESRESRTVAFAPALMTASASRGQESKQPVPIVETSSPSPLLAGAPFAQPHEAPIKRTTSIAGSIISVDESFRGGAIPDGVLGPNVLPYASLVCLGQAHTPYMPYGGAANGNHPASLYTASAISVGKPNPASYPLGKPPGGSSFHMRIPSQSSHHGMIASSSMDPVQAAIREFEDREVASDAEPLRDNPDEVIKGRHGLLRALILNDRQHVLTVDTAGQVSIWNIIQGVCIGRFSSEEINDLYHASGHDSDLREIAGRDSKEALEVVREHIEGEAFVVTWCSVDARIGSLTVHLEENRAFDAEVYADEVGYANDSMFKEDQRINLGKWTLANLFAGLIKAEALDIELYAANVGSPPSSNAPLPGSISGINRSPAPKFIPIDKPAAPPGRRLRSYSSLSSTAPPTPGGLMVGLATPAMTPAILPAEGLSRSYTENPTPGLWTASGRPGLGLAAIPQSPMTAGSSTGTTPAFTPSNAATKSPRTDGAGAKDYFSFRGTRSKATPGPGGKEKDPSPPRKSIDGVPPTPGGSVPPQTPGGGLKSKFKGFGGKNKKAAGVEQSLPTVTAEMDEDGEGEAEPEPKLSEAEAAQLKVLAAVRSHPFAPPPYTEAPPLSLSPNTALIISEESKDAGAWAATYRSMVARTEQDIEPLEMASPLWLLDYLFAGRSRVREPVKLCFILEPWVEGDEKDRMKAMPANNSRLTANRVLRIRKILHYIYDKLEMTEADMSRKGSFSSIVSSGHPFPAAAAAAQAALASAKNAALDSESKQPSHAAEVKKRPEDIIEVLCHGMVVPITMTLAATRQFLWLAHGGGGDVGGGDVVLQYRFKK